MTDTTALIAPLRKIAAGVQDLIDVLDGNSTTGETQQEREIALSKEFDRAPGAGLTREEASRACKRHGFMPQTVGAWAQGGYLEIRGDGLRYLGEKGRGWLEEHGVEVANP